MSKVADQQIVLVPRVRKCKRNQQIKHQENQNRSVQDKNSTKSQVNTIFMNTGEQLGNTNS